VLKFSASGFPQLLAQYIFSYYIQWSDNIWINLNGAAWNLRPVYLNHYELWCILFFEIDINVNASKCGGHTVA
jgi:hypothetical protein